MTLIVKHAVRGTEYVVEGTARAQVAAGTSIENNTAMIVYRSLDDGKLWCRSEQEFMDGRFDFLHHTISHQVGQPVEKVGGDYSFEGVVMAKFLKRDRRSLRYVVEDDRGVLHVYSDKNLRSTHPLVKAIESPIAKHVRATNAAQKIVSDLLVQHFENDPGVETVLNKAFEGIREAIARAL